MGGNCAAMLVDTGVGDMLLFMQLKIDSSLVIVSNWPPFSRLFTCSIELMSFTSSASKIGCSLLNSYLRGCYC